MGKKKICVAHHAEALEYKQGLKNANTACMREVFAALSHVSCSSCNRGCHRSVLGLSVFVKYYQILMVDWKIAGNGVAN